MNKKELIDKIAERADLTKKDTEILINAMTDCIMEVLAKGDKVQLMGFGTFETRKRKARQGRNPAKPNETVSIPASIAPVFKAGKILKQIVGLKRAE